MLAEADRQGTKRLVGVRGTSHPIRQTGDPKLPGRKAAGVHGTSDLGRAGQYSLTPDGKINRKALPDPELPDSTAGVQRPRNRNRTSPEAAYVAGTFWDLWKQWVSMTTFSSWAAILS